MITWNYRVFREQDGYSLREVFYWDDGTLGGCSEQRITPFGETVEALGQELEALQEALRLPVLTLAEIDAAVAAEANRSTPSRGPTLSLEQLAVEFGLTPSESPPSAGMGDAIPSVD